MEPKYRSYNQQDVPPRIPRAISASYYFSTEQAHGAGHMEPEFRRLQHGHIGDDYHHNLHHHHPHPQSRSQNMHEAIRREIEKERIREEIIMAEIVRRRVFEKKLMMEREIYLRRGSYAISYRPSPVMKLESPMSSSVLGARAEGWTAGERLGIALDDKEKQRWRHENAGSNALPFRRTANLRISEVKPALEGNKKKERMLIKSDENVSGSKRKSVTLPGELPADIIANKKAKKEWSCALCQIRTSGEMALEEHVLGKKHKSKEAELKAQKGGKNSSIGYLPSKAAREQEQTNCSMSSIAKQ